MIVSMGLPLALVSLAGVCGALVPPRPLSCPLTSLCVQLCCPPGHVYSGYGAGSNYEEYDDDESDYQLLARPLCEKYRQGNIFQKRKKKAESLGKGSKKKINSLEFSIRVGGFLPILGPFPYFFFYF